MPFTVTPLPTDSEDFRRQNEPLAMMPSTGTHFLMGSGISQLCENLFKKLIEQMTKRETFLLPNAEVKATCIGSEEH